MTTLKEQDEAVKVLVDASIRAVALLCASIYSTRPGLLQSKTETLELAERFERYIRTGATI